MTELTCWPRLSMSMSNLYLNRSNIGSFNSLNRVHCTGTETRVSRIQYLSIQLHCWQLARFKLHVRVKYRYVLITSLTSFKSNIRRKHLTASPKEPPGPPAKVASCRLSGASFLNRINYVYVSLSLSQITKFVTPTYMVFTKNTRQGSHLYSIQST